MKITVIEPFSKDDRGTVSEYYHERTGQHLIVFSHAGAVRGRHYHKGISLSKNPEILFLMSGTCTCNWREAYSDELRTETIYGPVKMEIPPYTWHEVIAVTDCCFLELNSLSEHIADTFYDG
jgi:dTDP-4-dehydrorhamnose 3,5-epimerase-like enzyme